MRQQQQRTDRPKMPSSSSMRTAQMERHSEMLDDVAVDMALGGGADVFARPFCFLYRFLLS